MLPLQIKTWHIIAAIKYPGHFDQMFTYFCFFLFSVLRMELRTLGMLGYIPSSLAKCLNSLRLFPHG